MKQIMNLALALSSVFILNQSVHADETVAETRDETAIKLVYGAGQTAYELAANNAQLTVAAVELASQLTGGTMVVTTGTLTQFAPDLRSFSYSPGPSDRLVVKFLNGVTVDLSIGNFLGDYAAGSGSFLSRAHLVQVRVQSQNNIDMEILTQQYNGVRHGEMRGSVVYQGVTYQVNMQLDGDYYFEIDSTGSEYRSRFTWTGTVQTPEQQLNLSEAQDGQIVTARNPSGRYETSSATSRYLAGSLRQGNDVYNLGDVKVFKTFRNGKPSEPERWSNTAGTILKNGALLASVRALYELPYAKIKAVFPNGGGVDLERWLIDTTP